MQLAGYTDLTRLNQGGMATIYRGHQTSLNRVVAIKFLSAEFLWDEQAKQLFEQESLVIAQLNHPNIIHIIDRGFNDKGRPYFVMEYVQGQDLSVMMQQGGMSMTTKASLIMQACKGLAFAHKNGVIHRDIKPANLLIDDEGNLKVLDFGIALLKNAGQPKDDEVVGTPDYMSPEQLNEPDKVSALSDVYSIGAVMYHLFTGKTQHSVFQDWQTPLSTLPASLAKLIAQCLQSEPKDRPQSADEVRLRLLRMLKGAHLGESQKREAKTAVGKVMDKFALLDVIKRNPFGAVYLFEDKSRNKLLVVKKRVKSIAGYREAQLLSHVKHPNIIRVHGSSKNKNAFIVVMQHMSGGSLQDRLSRPYRGNAFIDAALQICKAMSTAHHHNIIHGNLRPSNVLFDEKGQIRVTDFGLAEHSSTKKRDWYQPLVSDEPSIERDVYSAAAIFHHMLTGEPLKFEHRRLQPSVTFKKLDPRLQKLLRNMLEYDSDDYLNRFDLVIPVLKSLKGSIVEPGVVKAPRKSRKRLAWIIIPLAVGIAGTAYSYFNPDQFATVSHSLQRLLTAAFNN